LSSEQHRRPTELFIASRLDRSGSGFDLARSGRRLAKCQIALSVGNRVCSPYRSGATRWELRFFVIVYYVSRCIACTARR